jgi:hypothetical protein
MPLWQFSSAEQVRQDIADLVDSAADCRRCVVEERARGQPIWVARCATLDRVIPAGWGKTRACATRASRVYA